MTAWLIVGTIIVTTVSCIAGYRAHRAERIETERWHASLTEEEQ